MQNLQYDDVSVIGVSCLAHEELLARYVPDAFAIEEPAIGVMCRKGMGAQWMAGGYYSLIAVMTPARPVATDTEGAYVLVIWEEKTAPVPGGRESTRMPKVYADIPDHHRPGNLLSAHASYEGRVFLEMELELEKEFT